MQLKDGATEMSRRRKHADSPARRSTPRRAAGENCCRAAESGPRGSRAAHNSPLSRAGTRAQRRSQRRAAAGGGRSPGEKKETPTQVLKMDLVSCTFSSPNDPDGQTDIFWDQNSPMTKQLGKGRKKQISSAYSDEISHIVNRIAPQDEKPVTNSMLGVWIGETAIPCTPSVTKEKSRVKISSIKLKTKNREKELMKLAQQFDKNMEELDVIQEQDGKNHDFIQTTSEMGHLHNHKDSVQMRSDEIVPEINCTPIKKQMKGDTRISLAKGQNSSQKPFDQNVEAAFNAIFDGSTQMCSGQLSQDLSDAFLDNSKTSFRKKNAILQEEVITTETLLAENLLNKAPRSPSPQVDTTVILKSCVTPCHKTPAASNKQLDELTANDFEDDWESLLGSEPFLTENAEMLELFPSTAAQDTGQKAVCTSIGENDIITSRANMNLGGRLRDSKVTLDLPLKAQNRELRNAGEYRFSSHPGDESRKLPFTGSKVRFEKSVTNIVSKNEDDVTVSNITKVKEEGHSKCILNVQASNKSGSYTRYPNEQNYKLGINLPLKVPTTDPFDSAFLSKENIVCNTNKLHGSKFNSSFDDWNDPLLASEMIKACHQLETTWEADDVDDDLLYQACDDIERLTQQENKDSKESESINDTSKHASKHWDLVSSAVPLSLASKSQINKPVTVEKRDICEDCPNVLDATNLSVCSKNSSDNQHVPVQVNSSKFVLAGSSNLNVNLSPVSTKIATNRKLSTQQLSHNSLADKAQNDNKVLKLSKFTFKKKNSQFLSQLNQNRLPGSTPVSKISEDLGRREAVSSLLEANQQQSSIKYSESLKPSSPDEEERNRKYSPEEIQRKRQEALVRRKAKALHTVQSTPISLP
ncbi:ewing's tumor-associated antigen 1 [Grammomys surdaster]|uniref:ewing's tumor-associated antigen 1 n=1 Tax=Grammomys surdaster TaxID=491861 RepID=UPI00109FEFB3|nr:ewing's tumor-associated antigen 1 [Grammomys surdaster]